MFAAAKNISLNVTLGYTAPQVHLLPWRSELLPPLRQTLLLIVQIEKSLIERPCSQSVAYLTDKREKKIDKSLESETFLILPIQISP